VKLLIVAGPYEADRIRRAAASAGVEAVAVEPGESLSAWITATRPEVIVLAPQVISADPSVALAKIRAVPRGRVPILLVGEAGDEATFRPLADGFFVRPVAPDDLIAQAHAAIGAVPRALDDAGSGPQTGEERGSGPLSNPGSTPTGRRALRPLVADRESGPLPVTPDAASAVPVANPGGDSSRARSVPQALERLGEAIEADIDADLAAELRDVARAAGARAADVRLANARAASARAADARAVATAERGQNGTRRQASPGALQALAASLKADEPEQDALSELTDESSQKTREVPQAGEAAADELALDFPSLLARMYLSRLSGRLTLRAGVVRKHILFDEGHPVLAASSRVEDRFRELLVRDGRLTAARAAALGDEAASLGQRLGLLLVERGLLPVSELASLVRRHYEELLFSLFTWQRGAWTLAADKSLAAEPEKVRLSQHPSALILTGVRRDYGAPRALAGLGGAQAVLRLRPSAGLGDLLEKMELDEQERRAVVLFDGWRDLSAVAAAAALSLDTVATLAWTLTLLERLEAAPPAAADAAPDSEHGPTDGEKQTIEGDPAVDRDPVIDRALVQARHALVMNGDYFQVLGVSRDATADEIRRAHDALVASVDPATLHPAVAADLRAELDEIRAVLDEARGLLENDRIRQQYRAHLPPAASAALP